LFASYSRFTCPKLHTPKTVYQHIQSLGDDRPPRMQAPGKSDPHARLQDETRELISRNPKPWTCRSFKIRDNFRDDRVVRCLCVVSSLSSSLVWYWILTLRPNLSFPRGSNALIVRSSNDARNRAGFRELK
ncbi:hypothetical protein M758_6G047200, partial [Ceratodon purpureus]